MGRSTSLEWWRREPVVAIPEPGAPGSSVPFWALMTFTSILLLAPQNFLPVLVPFRIALLAAAVGIILHLADRFLHGQPFMIYTREVWITAGIVGWAILTVPLSYWPGGSVSFLLDFYFKTLAIFWLLINTVTTLSRLRQVAWGLSLMGVPLAATGVMNFLSGSFVQAGGEVRRIVGYDAPLTENPNDLALMLNLILPLSVALFLMNRKPVLRGILLGIIALEVMGVIVTFSRAGFLALATTFVMYVWKLRKRPERSWAVAALVLGLLCIPLLPSSYIDRLSTITDITSDPTGSSQARWSDTVSAVSFVARNPIIGAGVGVNGLALNQERGPLWRVIHNVYLEYAVELGIPGLILFLLLLVACLESAAFVQRRSAGVGTFRELFCVAEGIQISLIGFAVAGLFHPGGYHFYFYYLAGLAVAARTVYEAEAETLSCELGGPDGEAEELVAPCSSRGAAGWKAEAPTAVSSPGGAVRGDGSQTGARWHADREPGRSRSVGW